MSPICLSISPCNACPYPPICNRYWPIIPQILCVQSCIHQLMCSTFSRIHQLCYCIQHVRSAERTNDAHLLSCTRSIIEIAKGYENHRKR